ncbi:DUF2231 domain-containing protein [Georgenia faecalis]|uniref:DUF2231 domain-containing protein n=1 Tax=Georgenia faecalis TaxID=2483799 RepID=A0ABV9DBX3_9MICO|nr:DUF2231 domain-containing protein [Georgenia faecalis]
MTTDIHARQGDGPGGETVGQGHDSGDTPVLVRAALALEHTEALDPAVEALEPLAESLVAHDGMRRVLHGRVLGHALHPLLTDLPIGAWTSAAILDLTKSSPAAARRLIGVGILSALPTAVTGWAEWTTTQGGAKRVGVVHAGANSAALVLYTGSWLARRRGHHGVGVAISLAAVAAVSAGGYLGAHLALARKVATHHPAFDAEPPAQA